MIELNIREQVNLDKNSHAEESGDTERARVQQMAVKCRHYSPAVRKEAFVSLSKLFKDLADEDLNRLLSFLADTISRSFIDEDEAVRGVSVGFLQMLLRRGNSQVLSAFLPGWMQFCLLSLTHIEPAIRRDGFAFISGAVESKPELMLPYLAKILVSAAPGLSTRSVKPLKKGSKSEIEVVLQIMQLYTRIAQSKPDTKLYADYTWSAIQSRSLRLVRRTPQSTGLEPISSANISLLSAKVLHSISDGWLNLADEICANELSDETDTTRSIIHALRNLVGVCEADENVFWNSIPRNMMNVLGRDGRKKLAEALSLD